MSRESTTPQEHGLFQEQLRRFKEKETAEALLLIEDDPELTKIVVAWTGLDVRPVAKPTNLSVRSAPEVWDWLWANVTYSLDDLAERSCLSPALVERKLRPLIGNRILYPDGTINSFVRRYLRERVLKLFDTKPKKYEKAPNSKGG